MTRARRTPDPTRIAIDLPLPLDVAGTLSALIGLAYPSAKIDTRGGRQLWFMVDGADRARMPGKKRAAAVKEYAPEDPVEGGDVTHVDGTGWSVAPHEDVALALADMVTRILDADGEAGENYLEWQLSDRKDPSKQYVVYAARSKAQTPHALRTAAERALAQCQRELADARAELGTLRAQAARQGRAERRRLDLSSSAIPARGKW
jgi:hypothetical protein